MENAENIENAENTEKMENTDRRKWLAVMGAVPVLAGLGTLFAREQSGARSGFQATNAQSARELIQQRHLPNVPVVTHDGKSALFYQDLVKDKKVILTFVDTQNAPRESKKVVENLARLQRFFGKRVGRDMFMYTITSNPQHDTPAVLKTWATRYGASPGWQFLTGKPADLEKLRSSAGATSEYPEDNANSLFPIGIARIGVEPELRWAHCQSMAAPRVLAHSIQLDFGTDPTDPNPPPIWNCQRLVAGV
jgi:protein SCO1/2